MIWEGDMDFWQPAEQPEVMIVGPTRSGGTTIMTEGCSKGCQKYMSPESNHVITIITTSPSLFVILGNLELLELNKDSSYSKNPNKPTPWEKILILHLTGINIVTFNKLND